MKKILLIIILFFCGCVPLAEQRIAEKYAGERTRIKYETPAIETGWEWWKYSDEISKREYLVKKAINLEGEDRALWNKMSFEERCLAIEDMFFEDAVKKGQVDGIKRRENKREVLLKRWDSLSKEEQAEYENLEEDQRRLRSALIQNQITQNNFNQQNNQPRPRRSTTTKIGNTYYTDYY